MLVTQLQSRLFKIILLASARQKFNVESLGELEAGAAIETMTADGERMISAEAVATYRLWIIILGALSALMALAVLFMLTNK